ncbi:UNKNOWN [Stylonychia lemnae]|uniref:Uncharacterized protein n=1 Tax=Stylonychia lemnae TaxID=5949 RepID=A0A077ZQK4_STYLE|nr:UNKNOWN [Stylonychia lemnae]|eukprot:CDW71665.1 UNKNOWN [Stylonychia lemnae]
MILNLDLMAKYKQCLFIQIVFFCLCFSQLPIELGDQDSPNSTFTAINYDSSLDYVAIGGTYDSYPMIGLYNNKDYFRNYVLARIDFSGLTVSTGQLVEVGMFHKLQLNTMNVRADGQVYLISQDITEKGVIYVISRDLSTIIQKHMIDNKQIFFHSLYYYQTNQKLYLLGAQILPSGQSYSLFITNVLDSTPTGYLISAISSTELAQYQAIITFTAQSLGYLASCLESSLSLKPIFGLFVYNIAKDKIKLYYRETSSTFNQRGFQCIGVRVLSTANIAAFYRARTEDKGSIVQINYQKDPFSDIVIFDGKIGEWGQYFSETNTLFASQFNYLQSTDDYFNFGYLQEYSGKQRAYLTRTKQKRYYLMFISQPKLQSYRDLLSQLNLWKNQTIATDMDKYVGKLKVQYDHKPNILPSVIDCYLGTQCNVFQANYSLKPFCSDIGNLKINYNLQISSSSNNILFNNLLQSQSIFSFVSNTNSEMQLEKLELGPNQECFKQNLNLLPDQQPLINSGVLLPNQLMDFKIGLNTINPDYIGKYQFLIEVVVQADIEGFIPKKYFFPFNYEIYTDTTQFFITNTAPYFQSPLTDFELYVGDKYEYQLPSIKDDEGDDYSVSISSKFSSLFLEITNQKIIINPVEVVSGVHQVDVKIEDNNIQKLFSISKFILTIRKRDVSSFFESQLK